MSLPISSSSSRCFGSLSFPSVFPTPMIQRIQEIAGNIFSRISVFFNSLNPFPKANEGNLKTFALVSCLSLIALLTVSIFRKRDPHLTLTRIRTARFITKSRASRSIK